MSIVKKVNGLLWPVEQSVWRVHLKQDEGDPPRASFANSSTIWTLPNDAKRSLICDIVMFGVIPPTCNRLVTVSVLIFLVVEGVLTFEAVLR